MCKTEKPFQVDVHRNSLFLSSGEGRGWCLCCADTVACRYIHHTTYISYTCNFPCLEVDSFIIIIIFMPKVLTIRIREVLISRDSDRKVGRRHQLGSETKHQQLF